MFSLNLLFQNEDTYDISVLNNPPHIENCPNWGKHEEGQIAKLNNIKT